MANAQKLKGKHVLVVGLGRFGGGVAAARWLAQQGADVTVTDQAEATSLRDSIDELRDVVVDWQLGGHDPRLLETTDLAIINPAVNKLTSEFFQSLVHRGIDWTTEINLFCQRCPAPIVGITGTYGKSTTCAMLSHMLEACRDGSPDAKGHNGRVWLGGNIGRSLLGELQNISAEDVVVLELSSAQLEDLPRINWRPHIAVITNIWPHHLDRYPSYADYVATKLNLIGKTNASEGVIVGELCPEAATILGGHPLLQNGAMVRASSSTLTVELTSAGMHNRSNGACALAVCQMLGKDDEAAQIALRSFRGLPHRLEQVRVLEHVQYINDSKATAPGPTIAAIQSQTGPIILLLGGRGAGASCAALAKLAAERCRRVICFGESGPAMAEAVRSAATSKAGVVIEIKTALVDAVRRAHRLATPGDCVLFSPAAQSFDGFANFAERGECFTRLVAEL